MNPRLDNQTTRTTRTTRTTGHRTYDFHARRPEPLGAIIPAALAAITARHGNDDAKEARR